MNTSRSTSPDRSILTRTPFATAPRSLQEVQACTPTRNPGPMADWWARHAGNGSRPQGENPSLRSAEDIVGDTVTALRAALRRADDVESAVDLRSKVSPDEGETPSETLDYFGPAFRRALGRREDVQTEGGEAKTTEPAESTPEVQTNSLDYFAPAFRQALGDEDASASSGGSDPTGDAAAAPEAGPLGYFAPAFHRALGSTDAPEAPTADGTSGAGEEDAAESTARDPDALDYFAPAFRRALGHGTEPGPDAPERAAGEPDERGAMARLREAVRGMSRRGLNRLSELKMTSPSHTGLDLDRLAERFFGTQSRELTPMNGS